MASGGGALMSRGTFSGGASAENETVKTVLLPVTYIPDNPGAAAKGTKTAREITDAAEAVVAATVPDADTYNAGRNILDAGRAILASPSKAHTAERLAIAAGLVELDSGGASSSLTSSPSAMEFLENFVIDREV